jgi:hypothetical protein
MRRLLNLFPVDAADADRAAAEIRSLFHWPDFLAAAAYAGLLVIVLPAAILFLLVIGDMK